MSKVVLGVVQKLILALSSSVVVNCV